MQGSAEYTFGPPLSRATNKSQPLAPVTGHGQLITHTTAGTARINDTAGYAGANVPEQTIGTIALPTKSMMPALTANSARVLQCLAIRTTSL